MKSKRLVLALLGALMLSACSSDTGGSTTTTPADPTTTNLPATTTTTRPRLVNGGLTPVDPATLIPLPGYEALVSGANHSGTVSPNGRFAAIETWDDAASQGEVNAVDLDRFELMSRFRIETAIVGLTVTNDGTAFWTDNDPHIRIFSLSPGATDGTLIYDSAPTSFASIGPIEVLADERFGFVVENDEGQTSVLVVDAGSGTHTETPVPGADEQSPGTPDDFSVAASAWDHANERVLIVPGSRNVVLEVSIETGEVAEHNLDSGSEAASGARRDTALAPDGAHLYVATSTGEREDETVEWTPTALAVVDLTNWTTETIDVSVDTLFSSPLSEYVLAQGTDATEAPAGAEYVSGPVFVIEAGTNSALVGFETEGNARALVEFSNDGTLAYISTWSEAGRDIKTLDLALMQVTGAVAFERMSFVGEAGLLAFHLD